MCWAPADYKRAEGLGGSFDGLRRFGFSVSTWRYPRAGTVFVLVFFSISCFRIFSFL